MTAYDLSILDTGPSLNFFSIGREDLLLGALESISAQLAVPEDVAQEIRDKADEDKRFTGSDKKLDWALGKERIVELDSRSGRDPELDRMVARLTGAPWEAREQRARDQGERMVIAHAKAMMRRQRTVIVLIDEWRGQELAVREGVQFTTTLKLLRRSATIGMVASWGEMRAIYLRMRPPPTSKVPPKDEGLLHIDHPDVQKELHDPGIYGRSRRAGTGPS